MNENKTEDQAQAAETPAQTLPEFILGRLKDMTLEELKTVQEAIRLEVKGRTEEAKVAAKEAKEAAKEAGLSLKDQVKVGSTVTFTYKGGTKTAVVAKVTEKTFHVDAEEFGLDYKAGGQKFRYIQFAHLLSVVNAEPETAAA